MTNTVRRKLITGAAALSLLAAGGMSFAHGDDDEERFAQSQYRHDVMELAKYSLTNIVQHLQGKADHEGHVAKLANVMALSAEMSKAAFKEDTRGMDGKTEAKDSVWENWDDFAKRLDAYAADTAALAAAAKGGDMAEIGPAFKKAASHCKSCHDDYRK
ncbi:c-type cytochrome [Kordiimonas sp.]|uniref:c-type cytochrome n=1 Tax=Kordiimonas sp. TaxID=1970157 RepID=UPI003A8EA787